MAATSENPPSVPPNRLPVPSPEQIDRVAGPPGATPTTHLRAAAWIDRGFRVLVLRERAEHPYRAEPREPGLDARAVIWECKDARELGGLAGLFILLVPLPFLILNIPALVTAYLLIAMIAMLGRRVDSAPFLARWDLQNTALNWMIFVLGGIALFIGLSIAAAWAAARWLSEVSGGYETYDPVDPFASDLPPGAGADGAAGDFGHLVPFGWSCLLILGGWVAVGYWARRRRTARLHRIYKEGRSRRPPQDGRGDGHIPVTFYSEFTPFAGAGVHLDSWPLTIELHRSAEKRASPKTRGEEETGEPAPPTETNGRQQPEDTPARAKGTPDRAALLDALHDGIRAGLHRLGEEDEQGTALHKTEVADSLFVSAIRRDRPSEVERQVLPHKQSNSLSREWVRGMIRTPHERARYFIETTMSMWEGQIVAKAFVRVSLQGDSLRLEGDTHLIPPTAEKYRRAEEELGNSRSPENGFGVFLDAILNLGSDLGTNVREIPHWLFASARSEHNYREYAAAIAEGAVDHAPRLSIRELGAEPSYEQFFQVQDVRRFLAAVKERTMRSIADVLEANGYRTEAVEQVIQNINYGNQFGDNTTVTGSAIVSGDRNRTGLPSQDMRK